MGVLTKTIGSCGWAGYWVLAAHPIFNPQFPCYHRVGPLPGPWSECLVVDRKHFSGHRWQRAGGGSPSWPCKSVQPHLVWVSSLWAWVALPTGRVGSPPTPPGLYEAGSWHSWENTFWIWVILDLDGLEAAHADPFPPCATTFTAERILLKHFVSLGSSPSGWMPWEPIACGWKLLCTVKSNKEVV